MLIAFQGSCDHIIIILVAQNVYFLYAICSCLIICHNCKMFPSSLQLISLLLDSRSKDEVTRISLAVGQVETLLRCTDE